jgi:hypothetical protein
MFPNDEKLCGKMSSSHKRYIVKYPLYLGMSKGNLCMNAFLKNKKNKEMRILLCSLIMLNSAQINGYQIEQSKEES